MKNLVHSYLLVLFIFSSLSHAKGQSNLISTYAGTGTAGWYGDGGPATLAKINGPNILMVDPSGNLFFSDATNSRIRMVNPAGVITEIAGNGIAGWAGDGGPATAAEFNNPSGFAMDAAGNLYVGDQYNHVIRKIRPAVNGIVTTIAGFHGLSGFSGDGGPASAAKFNRPYYLSFDSYHNLYIVDQYNHVVRKITAHADTIATTDTITTFAGHGTVIGVSGDGGPATAALLNFPNCICIDSVNNVFISDNGNQRIRKVSNHDTISTIAGTGSIGWSGDGGPATNAQLNYPVGIKIDLMGNFIFADGAGNRIRKISPSGIISTICGTGVGGFTGDGVPATASEINSPLDVAIDPGNNVLIADYFNNRIRIIEPICHLPVLSAVSGPKSGCPEERITLSDSTSGGIWTGNDTSVATIVATSGVVTCVSAGVEFITYTVTNSCGTSVVFDTISVNPYAGTITGTDSLCPGDTMTFLNPISTGTWVSTNPVVASVSASGLVTGISGGRDTVLYIVTDSCGSDTASRPFVIGNCNNSVKKSSLQSLSFNVFPNPNNGCFNFELLSSAKEPAQITITNVLGETVRKIVVYTNELAEIRLSVAPGVYYVSGATGTRNLVTKIIIQ